MMAKESKLQGMVRDANLNKNIGNFSYWIHRITGIGLSVYLLMHTFVLSSAISGPEAFNERMGTVQNPFFAILEVLLIAGVFMHMLNGLRITITDFFNWSRGHKILFWIAAVIFVILMIVAIKLQWPKFFIENYGMGGH
ncbi:MAG: succinate dehydrogenase, cytochrome b556 subunit [Candidatus Zixiibacteriota bacterium]